MAENDAAVCPRCGNPVQPGDRFCGNCGAAVLPPAPQAEQVIPQPVAASQGSAAHSGRRPLLLAGVLGALAVLLVGGGVLAFVGLGSASSLLGGSEQDPPPPSEERGAAPSRPGTSQDPDASPGPTDQTEGSGSTGQTYGANTAEEERGFSTSASASPESSASPSSEEEILEEFGREYEEASRREDWAKTYSMLHESYQQEFTEEEWTQKMEAIREADGPHAPLADVIVEQNTETSDSPATITFVYEDGSETSMQAMIPMVVEDPSDAGVPKRFPTEEELAELEQVPTSSSSSASPANPEAEAEEAAEEYYRAAGTEDWGYTYENLDAETQSRFTREEWFNKNQWFADNGEVIYHIDSVDRVGTSTEYLGVTLTLTYEDGSSSTRNTYFVYEDGGWKHAFGQEENDLFMPDLSYEEFVEAQQ